MHSRPLIGARRRSTAVLSLFVLAVTVLVWPTAATGFAAADWKLPTPDGGEIGLHEALAQGPVVVSFWATWCIPCLKEMPKLNELAGEFAGRATFIAVNVDNSRSVAKVAPLVRSRNWTELIIGMDTAGTLQQALQVVSPPYLILYDQRGREVYRHEGYREGDELILKQRLAAVLEAASAPDVAADDGARRWQGVITATDQFKYSYSLETEAEIVENWLDVSYQFGGFRTGLLLNHQSPSEEGNRRNQIVHRFFEYRTGGFELRMGHFYGLFGRGLVWNSYEDRFIRVDTALDGVWFRGGVGPAVVQILSGTTGTTAVISDPQGFLTNSVDVRGIDVEFRPAPGLMLGASGLTFLPNLLETSSELHREWVGTGRAGYHHALASLYLEYGQKTGYEHNPTNLDPDSGHAFYGNLGLFYGPVSLSLERSDYERFTVVPRADGTQPLNRPPALVREHLYTLLGRKPHAMDQNDEQGWQLEAVTDLGRRWSLLANASRIEDHHGDILYEEAYGHVEAERVGDFRLRGAFGYQDSEGAIRQTVAGDVTWYTSPAMAWTVMAEHQHVRLGVLGAYDQQWFKLALDLPPRWTFDAMLETNNKHSAQFDPGEIVGDVFPSGQVTYALSGGGNLNLWFGKRQAGQICAGGVCKFEPAFEGVEFFGVFRY
jgi:cytochrome c biogenesis protein CcmG, thiol:disulfide interchange protein DsbE